MMTRLSVYINTLYECLESISPAHKHRNDDGKPSSRNVEYRASELQANKQASSPPRCFVLPMKLREWRALWRFNIYIYMFVLEWRIDTIGGLSRALLCTTYKTCGLLSIQVLLYETSKTFITLFCSRGRIVSRFQSSA